MTERVSPEMDISVPQLSSNMVRLRAVQPSDYQFLYELSMDATSGFRWRFRSGQPTYEEFVRSFGASVFVQYLIVRETSKERIGLAVCYRANRANRHAYIGIQGVDGVQHQGILVEAGRLFITFLFDCFGFIKLYAECPEFNLGEFRSALGNRCVEEGVLCNHEYYLNRWWNLHILALYRDSWSVRDSEGEQRIVVRESELSSKVLGLQEFCNIVGSVMEIQPDAIRPELAFVEDLGFDSIQMYELLGTIEELGAVLPDHVLANIRTFEDLHFHYLQGLRTIGAETRIAE